MLKEKQKKGERRGTLYKKRKVEKGRGRQGGKERPALKMGS